MRSLHHSTWMAVLAASCCAFDQPRAEVIPLSAVLDTTQPVPPPEAAPAEAAGTATFGFEVATLELTYDIEYSGLSSTEVEAHIHSGLPGTAGPVEFGLPLGNSKQGAVTLDEARIRMLLAGTLYVDVHTAKNAAGELRGRITVDCGGVLPFTATLDSDQVLKPEPVGVPAEAGGFGVFCFDPKTGELDYHITFSGLSSEEIAAHFHRGGPGENGPVEILLDLGSPKVGVASLNKERTGLLLGGNLYALVHSEKNPVGELRGQITPVPCVMPEAGPFLRGDCDGDGRLPGAVNDAIRNFQHCFAGTPVPCRAACDADADGNPCSGVTDGLRILIFIFRGGNPPPPPFPDCGPSGEPGDIDLGCEASGCNA